MDNSLRFERTYTDDDGMVRIHGSATLDGFSAHQDFYCHPDQVRDFAEQAAVFPRSPTDELVFEVGEEGYRDYSWFRLRLQVIDGVGHCFLSIAVSNNLDSYEGRRSEFGVACEVAAVNRLGRQLAAWSASPEQAIVIPVGA